LYDKEHRNNNNTQIGLSAMNMRFNNKVFLLLISHF
jgi:hypothetical protein